MAEQKTNVRITGNQLLQMANQERQRLDDINGKVQTLQNFRHELAAARDSIEQLGKTKKGQKIMVNLGAGIYVEATLENTEKAIASITGNVFKDKTYKEIGEILNNKIKNMDKTISGTAEQQRKAIIRLNQIEQVLAAGREHIQQKQ